MIQHIVTWKLNATDDSGRLAGFDAIAGALRPLANIVPEVVSLRVDQNIAAPEANWDVVLTSTFADLDDLAAYQAHPEHLLAAAIVRENASARASIDYEV
jgi:hypothetical protein